MNRVKNFLIDPDFLQKKNTTEPINFHGVGLLNFDTTKEWKKIRLETNRSRQYLENFTRNFNAINVEQFLAFLIK